MVIGPERLPKVARTVGSFIGKAQRYANQVRNDINAQIELKNCAKTQQESVMPHSSSSSRSARKSRQLETEVAQIHQQVEELRRSGNTA